MASSTASSPKRKRTDQSKTPPPSQAVVEKWSQHFNDPEADVILRSVDGYLFATRRAFLVAASPVFDDMFKIPQANDDHGGLRKEGQAAPGVLPVVEMTEIGPKLSLFLRWIHRDTFEAIFNRIDQAERLIDVEATVLPLLACAEKFDVKTAFPQLRKLIEKFVETDTANVLALAVIYGWRALALSAMTQWLSEIDGEPEVEQDPDNIGCALYNVRTNVLQPDVRPWSIACISTKLFGLLPSGFFFFIARAEQAMLFSYSFDLAETVSDFMRAFDNGFPLECAISPVTLSDSDRVLSLTPPMTLIQTTVRSRRRQRAKTIQSRSSRSIRPPHRRGLNADAGRSSLFRARLSLRPLSGAPPAIANSSFDPLSPRRPLALFASLTPTYALI